MCARRTYFEADPHLVPSSFHCAFDKYGGSVEGNGGQSAIVICQNGTSLSQGAAALLGIRVFQRRCWKGGLKHGGRRGFR